jgi:hypothetical protein
MFLVVQRGALQSILHGIGFGELVHFYGELYRMFTWPFRAYWPPLWQ